MPSDRITYLLQQHLNDAATIEEKEELMTFIRQHPQHEETAERLQAMIDTVQTPVWDGLRLDELVNNVINTGKTSRSKIYSIAKWGWAAAVVLLLGTGAYWWMAANKRPQDLIAGQKLEKKPGSTGAILTLADGSQVVLDSLGNGIIATQNGTNLLLQDGGLSYQPAGKTTAGISYNTMTTPKGRQFQLALPDGTKAWLNAASSITYPTSFNGKERLVKITGEVYLEVAENEQMPFRVNVNGRAEIAVLGTHFNVNAYADEASINTTLLEGAVKVSARAAAPFLLQPGQQAQIVQGGTMRVVNNADINKIMAWKNGLFNFQGLTLGEVLRQIGRWYDIEISYNGDISHLKFWGEMYRNVNLSDVLDMLKDMGVKYQWDGKKLTIL